jgi:predicted acylesterase/phospholipase RssA
MEKLENKKQLNKLRAIVMTSNLPDDVNTTTLSEPQITPIDQIEKDGIKLEKQPRPLRLVRNESEKNTYKDIYNFQKTNKIISKQHITPDSSWIYDIKNIVFSGGGVKGYAYTGILKTLDSLFLKKHKNLYQQVTSVSGTSVGSMFALYFTLGVRGNQLLKEVKHTNIFELTHHMNIQNLMENYGLCPSAYFKRIVYDVLERYVGKGDITFQELYDLTQKTFICCVTNLTTGEPEYHSHQTVPSYRVFESVAASMSVPLLFSPCIINGQCFVDGGLQDNCPFRMFPIEETMILYLDGWKRSTDMSSFENYVVFFAHSLWKSIDRTNFRLIPDQHLHRIVRIYIEGVSAMDVRITHEQRDMMIQQGSDLITKLASPTTYLYMIIKSILQEICTRLSDKLLAHKK